MGNKTEQLLPCPFCGGEASATGVTRRSSPSENVKWEDGTPIQDSYFVNCIRCGVDNGDVIAGGHQTREKAIAAWNRRAPAPSDLERQVREHMDSIVEAECACEDFVTCASCQSYQRAVNFFQFNALRIAEALVKRLPTEDQ